MLKVAAVVLALLALPACVEVNKHYYTAPPGTGPMPGQPIEQPADGQQVKPTTD